MPYVWNAKWDKDLAKRGLDAVRNALADPEAVEGAGTELKGFPGHNRAYMQWWVQRQLDEEEQKATAVKRSDNRLKIGAAFVGPIATAVIPILIPIMGVLIATAFAAAFGYFVAWIN